MDRPERVDPYRRSLQAFRASEAIHRISHEYTNGQDRWDDQSISVFPARSVVGVFPIPALSLKNFGSLPMWFEARSAFSFVFPFRELWASTIYQNGVAEAEVRNSTKLSEKRERVNEVSPWWSRRKYAGI